MASEQGVGPLGCGGNRSSIDGGTLAPTLSPTAGVCGTRHQGRSDFESAIRALEAEIANVGAHLTLDAAARQAYARQIRDMADDLRTRAGSGRISWREAATLAQETRNTIMDIVRQRSTPVGRAMAQRLKREGHSLNALIARKTVQLHGEAADFHRLSAAQQNQVYAEIVRSAGTSNPRVTASMQRLSRAGRGLIVTAMALSVYAVATADDKVAAAGRELTVSGAGVAGGFAGGALAGLACGPGAPVCVTVGAFIGGALAAFGSDMLWPWH